MEFITVAITKLNEFLVLISLISVFYWTGFLAKNWDERGFIILGKSSIVAFGVAIFFVGFTLLFNLSGKIEDGQLKEYLLFTYTLTVTIFSITIFIFNKRL